MPVYCELYKHISKESVLTSYAPRATRPSLKDLELMLGPKYNPDRVRPPEGLLGALMPSPREAGPDPSQGPRSPQGPQVQGSPRSPQGPGFTGSPRAPTPEDVKGLKRLLEVFANQRRQ